MRPPKGHRTGAAPLICSPVRVIIWVSFGGRCGAAMCDVCPRYGAQPAECVETPPSQSHRTRPKLLVIYARGCLLPNPAPRPRAEVQSGIPLSLPLAVFK